MISGCSRVSVDDFGGKRVNEASSRFASFKQPIICPLFLTNIDIVLDRLIELIMRSILLNVINNYIIKLCIVAIFELGNCINLTSWISEAIVMFLNLFNAFHASRAD